MSRSLRGRTLVDTSVWVAFFRGEERARRVATLCAEDAAVLHPWVLGELSLGGLSAANRALLHSLDRCPEPSADSLLGAISGHGMANRGIGFVDAALVHATHVDGVRLWTFDALLAGVARDLAAEDAP